MGIAKFYSSGNRGVKNWPGPREMGSSGFPVASLHAELAILQVDYKINGF